MSDLLTIGPVQAAGLVFFCGLMVAAGVQDALTMKISNKISIALILGFLLYAIAAPTPPIEVAIRVATMVAIFAILLVPYHYNLMGGGDVKLLAAGSLWFQAPEPLFLFIALTSIFGGLVTLATQFIRNWPMPVFIYRSAAFERWQNNSRYVPYGIGIGMGALIAQYLLLTPILR